MSQVAILPVGSGRIEWVQFPFLQPGKHGASHHLKKDEKKMFLVVHAVLSVLIFALLSFIWRGDDKFNLMVKLSLFAMAIYSTAIMLFHLGFHT